jgi:hypothetical protein
MKGTRSYRVGQPTSHTAQFGSARSRMVPLADSQFPPCRLKRKGGEPTRTPSTSKIAPWKQRTRRARAGQAARSGRSAAA